jgi:hypothetical protein
MHSFLDRNNLKNPDRPQSNQQKPIPFLEEREFCSINLANATKSVPITADHTLIIDRLQLLAAILAR